MHTLCNASLRRERQDHRRQQQKAGRARRRRHGGGDGRARAREYGIRSREVWPQRAGASMYMYTYAPHKELYSDRRTLRMAPTPRPTSRKSDIFPHEQTHPCSLSAAPFRTILVKIQACVHKPALVASRHVAQIGHHGIRCVMLIAIFGATFFIPQVTTRLLSRRASSLGGLVYNLRPGRGQ